MKQSYEDTHQNLGWKGGRIAKMCPCHLIFLVPVLGVLLFWLLPLGYALAITVVIVLIAVFLYWLIRRAIRKPVQDGFQSLIGTEAEVVSSQAPNHSARYLVRFQGEGELWSAYSTDVLEIGEQVNVVAVKGIGVVVERAENNSRSGEVGNAN